MPVGESRSEDMEGGVALAARDVGRRPSNAIRNVATCAVLHEYSEMAGIAILSQHVVLRPRETAYRRGAACHFPSVNVGSLTSIPRSMSVSAKGMAR